MSADNKRSRTGVVVKRSADQTIAVLIEGLERHSRYERTVRTRRRFVVHDPKNEASIGDKVLIIEDRPISKTKHWVLKEIIEKVD